MNICRKTGQLCDIYLKIYTAFCCKYDTNPLLPMDTTIVKLLTEMHHTGYGYSSLNIDRATMKGINRIGSSPFREEFGLQPHRLRYTIIWDVSLSLNYLRSLSPASKLNLLTLSAELSGCVHLLQDTATRLWI